MSSKATPARITDTTDRTSSAGEPEIAETTQQQPASRTPRQFTHEECSQLAYSIWQQRGCPEGTAEADWFEAEEQLRNS